MCMCTIENWEIHNGKTEHKIHWKYAMLMNLWVHNPYSFCHKNTVFITISNEKYHLSHYHMLQNEALVLDLGISKVSVGTIYWNQSHETSPSRIYIQWLYKRLVGQTWYSTGKSYIFFNERIEQCSFSYIGESDQQLQRLSLHNTQSHCWDAIFAWL